MKQTVLFGGLLFDELTKDPRDITNELNAEFSAALSAGAEFFDGLRVSPVPPSDVLTIYSAVLFRQLLKLLYQFATQLPQDGIFFLAMRGMGL